ncbi:MAG: hypothetical protein J5732_00810 [Bacteroidaceae bacterium]|nr:hypothetical protein [Bacteroidaceae bacterium]
MKATIKTYQTNADVWFNEESKTINWDGLQVDSAEEYNEWIDNELAFCKEAENYQEIRQSLAIATEYIEDSTHVVEVEDGQAIIYSRGTQYRLLLSDEEMEGLEYMTPDDLEQLIHNNDCEIR